ncbi:MAG: 1-deoxy-D-xylulose-5-phosphate synthase [Spirochaetaceae bacterium]|nr:1-deoxy-D-xylulose-5-phosphate synthase [Spirochaetaceae bacterium]
MDEDYALLQELENTDGGGRALRDLNGGELKELCGEIRRLIIKTVSANGGHLSSNLGVVELTVALHKVFNLPKDKIVWDVGHQCYAHKILSGRFKEFGSLRKSGGVAGFPRLRESVCDAFDTGHASTSISAALGMLAAAELAKEDSLSVAVIGDGALTGGLAYEALSGASHLGLPLIVALNDNKMSISRNVGGLSRHLSRLSMRPQYQTFRRTFDSASQKIPFAGDVFFNFIQRLKRAVKAVFYHDNFFVDLGFEYVGPIDGHNIEELTGVFNDVRNLRRPVVVHVVTRKGEGFPPAEKEPGAYHSVQPFFLPAEYGGSGPFVEERAAAGEEVAENWTQRFACALKEAGERDEKVAAITAAMEKGAGLGRFKAAFPSRFFDVGIAEAHAITFSAALAASGFRPVAAIYSTFMQRAVDQVIHDVAVNSLPVVFAVDRAGFVSGDGETHQGLFDISLFRAAPSVIILAPAYGSELDMMLEWALKQKRPCIIRYPKADLPPEDGVFIPPIEEGRGVFLNPGCERAEICLAFTGGLLNEAQVAAEILLKSGISCALYNLRFISGVDEDYFTGVMKGRKLFAVAEEGVKSGGFGEFTARLAVEKGLGVKIGLFSAEDKFYAQGDRDELLRLAGLDGASMAASILGALDLFNSPVGYLLTG